LSLFPFRRPRQVQAGAGLLRFQEALRAVPPGGEAHVWVRLPVQLGDMVMALPSLFTVKHIWEAWAQAQGKRLRFTVMGKLSASLFQESVPQVFAACHVDATFPAAGSPIRLMSHWREHKPLAIINYSKSDRIKLAAWLSRVPVRAGIGDGGNTWCYHYSHPYLPFHQVGHRVFRLAPMTQWLAGPEADPRLELLGSERFGGLSVLDQLRAQGWEGGPYVVFGPNPLQRSPERRWFPLDAPWLRLAELARRDGITPVLVGGPESREELDRLALASGGISLAGRTTLPQLMALLAHAMGTIAVDTGIAHLAAATGQPTVVVFGFGSEFLDLPCGPRVVSLRGDPAGSPAYPLTGETMRLATAPWSVATSRIPAERAWGILGYLAGEGSD
jgi:ADP-heptose:LPS heptosyltransferase